MLNRRSRGIIPVLVLLLACLLVFGCAGKRTDNELAAEANVPADAGESDGESEEAAEAEPSSPEESEAVADAEPGEEPAEGIESSMLPGEEPVEREEVVSRRGIKKPPPYRFLARALQYYERRMGVEFYRNKKGVYTPYTVAAWDSFSIADKEGECLYDVEVLGMRNFRHLDGKRQVLLDLLITEGPCNLRYPDADAAAADRVNAMEGTVISPRLLDKLGGGGMCSDKKFLQRALQVPYKMEIAADDVEGSVDRIAEEVENPLNMRFGDVVFFSPYPEERAVGVYVGYGLIVYNGCFGGKAHMMRASGDYRIYRLYTGFDWTRYRIHQEKFLRQYVGEPR